MEIEKVARKIEEGIREEVEEARRDGVVLGLSGGVDSSLVAYLSMDALGPERVHCLIMPYGECTDTEDAILVANILRISYEVKDIKPRVDAAVQLYSPDFDDPDDKGNLMARERMSLLMNAARRKNYLVIGTSNKSELEIGYGTKYGDLGVDFQPIGDLYKTEVWSLAEYKNLPKHIIEKVPSARLKPGQTDVGDIRVPSYNILDRILKGETEGIEKCFIERIEFLKKGSAHKRRMPPIIKIK